MRDERTLKAKTQSHINSGTSVDGYRPRAYLHRSDFCPPRLGRYSPCSSGLADIVSAVAGASIAVAGPPGPRIVPFPHRLVSWPVKSKLARSSGV